jgi:hypothetical protein
MSANLIESVVASSILAPGSNSTMCRGSSVVEQQHQCHGVWVYVQGRIAAPGSITVALNLSFMQPPALKNSRGCPVVGILPGTFTYL